MMVRHIRTALLAAFALSPTANAQNRAVIDDPDGYVNVRAGSSADAKVVAKVKTAERFTFDCEEAAEWCKVRLASGKSGWMHRSRIRLECSEKDRVDLPLTNMPAREGDSEVAGAIHGHEHIEPVRWETADVLVLQRHEDYQTLKPRTVNDKTFETVHSFDRLYEITATFSGDGKATVVWSDRSDRG